MNLWNRKTSHKYHNDIWNKFSWFQLAVLLLSCKLMSWEGFHFLIVQKGAADGDHVRQIKMAPSRRYLHFHRFDQATQTGVLRIICFNGEQSDWITERAPVGPKKCYLFDGDADISWQMSFLRFLCGCMAKPIHHHSYFISCCC